MRRPLGSLSRPMSNASLLLAAALSGCGVADDGPGEASGDASEGDRACSSAGSRFRLPTITLLAGPLAGSVPWAIVRGPDDGVWFSDGQAMTISRLGTDGTLLGFPAPFPTDSVFEIALGSDDNVWFEYFDAHWVEHVGRMGSDGEVTLFEVPSGNAARHMTLGPDGNVWFTAGENIGMITPDGAVGERPLGIVLGDISRGPGDTVWFTEPDENRIGRLSADGALSHFDVPTPRSGLSSIALGPDRNLWFTEGNTGNIGRVTDAGVMTEFAAVASPWALRALTAGPDGNLWFTVQSGMPGVTRIGRISTCGVVTEFDLPEVFDSVDFRMARHVHAVPTAITADARALWVTAQLEPFETGAVFRVSFEE